MKLQFQNMHRGGKSGSRKEPFNKLLQAEAVCAFKFKVFFDTVIEKLEMMWQFYGLILIEAKICLPTVIKLEKSAWKQNLQGKLHNFCSVTKFDDISGMKVFKKWPMIDESSILGIPELLESSN